MGCVCTEIELPASWQELSDSCNCSVTGLRTWHPKAEHQKVKVTFGNINHEVSLEVPPLPDSETVERYSHHIAQYWGSYLPG